MADALGTEGQTTEAPSTAATPADAAPGTAAATLLGAENAPEAKPGESETKEGEKPAEVNYEFKLPEGVKLDGESLDALKAFAKEKGLTLDDAQKIADLGVKQAQALQTQFVEQHKAAVAEWQSKTSGDKEIGGDKLQENLGYAKAALDQFGTPELKKLLNESGLGNHPEVVRVFVKAGKAISEDREFRTGQAAQQERAAKPIENRLYPNMK